MIDKNLLNRLEQEGLIDQRFLLWWQLGYEGRRVFSEEEFEKRLTNISYEARGVFEGDSEVKQRDFRFWSDDNVPILIKQVDSQRFMGAPVFISVKPILHHNPMITIAQFWRGLNSAYDSEPLPFFDPPD